MNGNDRTDGFKAVGGEADDLRLRYPAGQGGVETPVMEARQVARVFRQGEATTMAVQGVSLHLRRGEFLVITGPSGSGKSTLLHLLSALDRPDEGSVMLEGRSISSLDERQLALVRRRSFGFVLQFYNLMPTLNAVENAAFPLLLDGAPDALDRARQMLANVGLDHREDHRPSQMSGGEQQRTALARALASEPAVVFADEPTGNLDTASGLEVLSLLRRTADAGQTIVMVTHDPKVASFADREIRLVDGQVADRPTSAHVPPP